MGDDGFSTVTSDRDAEADLQLFGWAWLDETESLGNDCEAGYDGIVVGYHPLDASQTVLVQSSSSSSLGTTKDGETSWSEGRGVKEVSLVLLVYCCCCCCSPRFHMGDGISHKEGAMANAVNAAFRCENAQCTQIHVADILLTPTSDICRVFFFIVAPVNRMDIPRVVFQGR